MVTTKLPLENWGWAVADWLGSQQQEAQVWCNTLHQQELLPCFSRWRKLRFWTKEITNWMAKLDTPCRVCLYMARESLYHSYSMVSSSPGILQNFKFIWGEILLISPELFWLLCGLCCFHSLGFCFFCFLNSLLINVIITDSGNGFKQSLGNTPEIPVLSFNFQHLRSFI